MSVLNKKNIDLVYKFIKLLNLSITKTSIKDYLLSHPSYPSFYSISDALKNWNIQNASYKLPADRLEEIPLPAFVHLKKPLSESLSILTKVNGEFIERLDAESNVVSERKEDFLSKWTGVVMMVDSSEAISEKDYKAKVKNEKLKALQIPFLLTIMLFVILNAFYFFDFSNLYKVGLFSLKIVGAVVSTMLMLSQFDQSNTFVDRFCKAGKKTNCKSVINSSYATLFWGKLKWSEVGGIYFFTALVIFLAFGPSDALLSVFLIFNVLSLPYTIYSIWLQFFKIKKICTLCLLIQFLIWGELFFLLPYYSGIQNLQLLDFYPFLFSGFLVLLLGVFFKYMFLYSSRNEFLTVALNRVKNDPDIFKSLLLKNQNEKISTRSINPIVIGNPNANNTITVVSSPTCNPCKRAHLKLDKVITEENDVNLEIVFLVDPGYDPKTYKIAEFLMTTYLSGRDCKKIIHACAKSEKLTYENLTSLYDIDEVDVNVEEVLFNQFQWCEKNGIGSTPTIFINGLVKPDFIDVENLQFILPRFFKE